MTDSLAAMLGLDSSQPEDRLAIELVAADRALMRELVALRKEHGLSQSDVADLLGISQPSVQAFEKRGNDPRLSTIRRYAAAIGARVRHVVEAAEAGRDSDGTPASIDLEPHGRTWKADVIMNDGVVELLLSTHSEEPIQAFLTPPTPADSKRHSARSRRSDTAPATRASEEWAYQ